MREPYESGHLRGGGITLNRKIYQRLCEICKAPFAHATKLTCSDKCKQHRLNKIAVDNRIKKR